MDDGADLIRDLVSLRDRRETGVLEVRRADARAFLYVDRGEPVFAEHGTLGDTLGRLLLRRGTITSDQYGEIIRVMTSQLVDNEQMRFGEVAVELGYLSHEQMREALAAQVREKILTCIEWESAERVFVRGGDALEGIARFPCPVDAIVLDALRGFHDESRVHAILEPHLDRYVAVAWESAELEQRLRLTGAERRFVRLVRGRKKLRSLLAAPGDGDSMARLAAALVLLGAFALRDAAPPSGPASGFPRPAPLPVDRERIAPEPAPRAPANPARAFSRLARDLRVRPPGPPVDERPAADPRAARPAPRKGGPEMGERERGLAAELALRAGRAHMAAAAWREALEELRRARELDPTASEYGLYVQWAELQASPNDPEAEGRRVALAREAVAQRKRDPHFGFAYYVVGALRMDDGDLVKAEVALKKSIELDPQNRDAERRLRLLHMRMKKKPR